MTTSNDIKFRIDDELEAILHRIQHLELDIRKQVACKAERDKLLAALAKVEIGVDCSRKILGE